jgi:inorganic pyrophosphatase
MTFLAGEPYWQAMQALLSGTRLVIDRSKGQPHPRYPELVYPLDYGYLEGTAAGDGDGIDVWVGSLGNKQLTGILCTFDTVKRDAEVKLLAGCNAQDVEAIRHFNDKFMHYLYIPRP